MEICLVTSALVAILCRGRGGRLGGSLTPTMAPDCNNTSSWVLEEVKGVYRAAPHTPSGGAEGRARLHIRCSTLHSLSTPEEKKRTNHFKININKTWLNCTHNVNSVSIGNYYIRE